jgi:hypothetical protein
MLRLSIKRQAARLVQTRVVARRFKNDDKSKEQMDELQKTIDEFSEKVKQLSPQLTGGRGVGKNFKVQSPDLQKLSSDYMAKVGDATMGDLPINNAKVEEIKSLIESEFKQSQSKTESSSSWMKYLKSAELAIFALGIFFASHLFQFQRLKLDLAELEADKLESEHRYELEVQQLEQQISALSQSKPLLVIAQPQGSNQSEYSRRYLLQRTIMTLIYQLFINNIIHFRLATISTEKKCESSILSKIGNPNKILCIRSKKKRDG